MATSIQAPSGAISQATQAGQRELPEPWGSHCHYPRGPQATSGPCSAHRHCAGCTAFLAGLQQTVPRACSQHPKDTLSFLQGALAPEHTPPDTASYPHCTLLTHPGHFPAVWGRNQWWFIFLQATSQLKTFLKLAGASSPSLPRKTHFSGELWEFTLPPRCDSGSPSLAFAKASAVTCGITSAASLLGRELHSVYQSSPPRAIWELWPCFASLF